MRKVVVLFLCVAMLGCEKIGENFQILSEDQKKELPELQNELRAEAQLISACKQDSDCSTVGLKPKPCSGYEEYVTVSLISNRSGSLTESRPSDDYLLLLARIRSFEERVKTYYRETDTNICLTEVIEAPRSRCDQNKCVLVPIQSFDSSLIDQKQSQEN